MPPTRGASPRNACGGCKGYTDTAFRPNRPESAARRGSGGTMRPLIRLSRRSRVRPRQRPAPARTRSLALLEAALPPFPPRQPRELYSRSATKAVTDTTRGFAREVSFSGTYAPAQGGHAPTRANSAAGAGKTGERSAASASPHPNPRPGAGCPRGLPGPRPRPHRTHQDAHHVRPQLGEHLRSAALRRGGGAVRPLPLHAPARPSDQRRLPAATAAGPPRPAILPRPVLPGPPRDTAGRPRRRHHRPSNFRPSDRAASGAAAAQSPASPPARGRPRAATKSPSTAPAAARTPKVKSRCRDTRGRWRSSCCHPRYTRAGASTDGRELQRPSKQRFLKIGERLSGKRCQPHALHGGKARSTLLVQV